eukprot:s2500_g13.t1
MQKVFRYLDPDNSGSISRKEWSTMMDLQKEVLQQLEDFALFLHRLWAEIGGVSTCWSYEHIRLASIHNKKGYRPGAADPHFEGSVQLGR